jgi:hypothetical protein
MHLCELSSTRSFDDLTSKLGHATIPSSRFCRLISCRRRHRTSFCVVGLFPLLVLSSISPELDCWSLDSEEPVREDSRTLYDTSCQKLEMHFQVAVAKIELPLLFICKAALRTCRYRHFDVKVLLQMQGRIAYSCQRFYSAAVGATCRRG